MHLRLLALVVTAGLPLDEFLDSGCRLPLQGRVVPPLLVGHTQTVLPSIRPRCVLHRPSAPSPPTRQPSRAVREKLLLLLMLSANVKSTRKLTIATGGIGGFRALLRSRNCGPDRSRGIPRPQSGETKCPGWVPGATTPVTYSVYKVGYCSPLGFAHAALLACIRPIPRGSNRPTS